MDFAEPENWRRIRAEAEAFTAENVTPAMLEEELRTGDGVSRPLMEAMGRRGWITPTWPAEEGGAGLDPFEAGVMLAAIRAGGGPTV
ncbi:MAG: acyl-CoA dehydrogenase family protein, partial [Acidimicrobiales bacterium]